MEEVARYGSPRPTRDKDGGTPKKSKGSALARQPPSASDLVQLRKMIQSSADKDGAPRLDSVSLYSLGKLLGKGAFGAVKMGVHKLTGSVVAIKNFKKADVKNEVEARAIDREIRILKQSVHQHVIKLYEVIDSPTNYYLVMECAAHGDLAGHLEKKGRLREAESAKYLVQTMSAIAYCHANGVIHRDIKPENLLLDANYDIKVTDFGLSAIIKPGQLLKVACGTPSYSAPEVIARKEYDGTLTDVWSLGVLLYHLTHGCLPFNDTAHIRAGDYHVSTEHIVSSALDLLRKMLVVKPENRITLATASGHPWVASWRSHAMREPRRRFGLTHNVPDNDLVQHLEDKFGLRSEHVVTSLKAGRYNHATATYSLLEEEKG
jgi:5'-AMP-activated protein kinase catalytic alpha subunit